MKIGLLSDTHSWLDDQVFHYFKDCDELWHAGDIGHLSVAKQLAAFKPLRAVYGNIDDQEIRRHYPASLFFMCEDLQVWMTHIGGKPSHYTSNILNILKKKAPDVFVCGHSHILRVMQDPKHRKLLYLNPGAAGKEGFHQIRTLLRFEVYGKKISNVQAIELGKRS